MRRFLSEPWRRSAGAWKVMEYLRMISDWLRPRGLVLTVIGKVIGKGLIGHHWKSAEKGKTAWRKQRSEGTDSQPPTNQI